MNKNTGTRTATTFTVDPALTDLDPEDAAELAKPYVWDNLAQARRSVELLENMGGMYRVTRHEVPGLEVVAVYRMERGEARPVLMSVILFEDRTAARLHTAVRKAQPVTVTYVKADGEETVRTIEPTGLSLTKAGDVLIKAADRASGDRRSFRLDRVRSYTLHRTAFLVRNEAPAPSKAELVQAFQARDFVPARPVIQDTCCDEIPVGAWMQA